jgi:Na+-transporting methylmalonyl-CoA/oxaloacetate decarboxylase gamma subunit
MRTRTLLLIALLLGLAALGFAQATGAPVPEHSAAEKAMGGPLQLGFMLMFIGMIAVFSGLFLIYLFLVFLRRLSDKRAPVVAMPEGAEGGVAKPFVVTAEMASAIAMALFMDLRTFDEGTAEEITIRKITKPFSPWWNAAKTQIIFDKVEMFRRKY